MSRLRNRWVYSSALIAVCLAVFIYFLIGTASGSQVLWGQLVRWVPGLEGQLLSGSLSEGWQIGKFRFRNQIIDISAESVAVSWALPKLLGDTLDIESVKASQLHIQRFDNPDHETEADHGPVDHTLTSWISTPVPLKLHRLQVDDFRYSDPVVVVTLHSLQGQAGWIDHQVTIPHIQASQLDVELLSDRNSKPSSSKRKTTTKPKTVQTTTAQTVETASSKTEDSKQKTSKQASPQKVTLPWVFVPLDIVLEQLDLHDGRYHQQGFDTGHLDVDVAARMIGSLITVGHLTVNDPQMHRTAKLGGQIELKDAYPMVVSLMAHSAIPQLNQQPREATATVKGDLGKLLLDIKMAGAEQLSVHGSLSPLDPLLPFQLDGQWQQLPLPESLDGLQIKKGKLSAKGSLKSYTATLQVDGRWQSYPSVSLKTDIQGNLQQLTVQKLDVADSKNQILVTGHLQWQDGVAWEGKTDLALHQLNDWMPDIVANVQGKLTQKFKWKDNHWQMSVNDVALHGQWNHYPLTLQGDVSGTDGYQWEFKQVKLENGPNEVLINGQLQQTWQLNASIKMPALKTIQPGWKGGFTGLITMTGPGKTPTLIAKVDAPMVHTGNVWLKNLALRSQVQWSANPSGDINLHVEKLFTGPGRFFNIQSELKGTGKQHSLAFSVDGRQVKGQIALSGALNNGHWQGQLIKGDLDGLLGHWLLQKPVTFVWNQHLQQLKMSAQCWLSQPAQLCLGDSLLSGHQGKIPLKLNQFAFNRLERWLPDGMDWQGTVAADGWVGWKESQPLAQLSVVSKQGQWVASGVKTPYQNLQVLLGLDARLADIRFNLISSVLGNINSQIQVKDPLHRKQLSGQVDVTALQLAPIAPLVETLHQTSGQMDVHGKLGGTLKAPLFYGQVQLKNAAVSTSPEMVNLTAINGVLTVSGDSANLNLGMNAGKGKILVTGHSYWPGGNMSGSLNVSGQDADVLFAGYGQGRVNSNIQLTFNQERADLSGQVIIPSANVEVKSLPESGVSVSDDIHVVRKIENQTPAAPPYPFYMDLDLVLGNDVHFSAMGLKTALEGDLRFHQKPGQALMTQGEIRLVDGRFKAYGQNLIVRSGKLSFNGDISTPYVMAEAIRDPNTMEDSSVTVGVKINAPINALSAKIFSEPELSDTDKLSYLLRGKSSTSTTNGSTEEAMAAMMLGAGLSQTNGVVSDVASTFGLKDAGFDTSGSGTDTQVNLSAYVLKDLQLQYGVGVYSAVSEVKLKYFFLPHLYFQAVSGLDQAVDLFYKFEF